MMLIQRLNIRVNNYQGCFMISKSACFLYIRRTTVIEITDNEGGVNMATPHNKAELGEIAKTVLMPGDPLRAKYIAEKFLKNARMVTSIRNLFGFTGTYKNHEITIMGSGMGMPSMSIYAFELFYYFNVEKIIRIGTCGVVTKDINVPELILADDVFSLSNFAYNYDGYDKNMVYPSKKLNENITSI